MRILGLITTGTATLVAGVVTMTLGLIVALVVAPVGSAFGLPAAAAQPPPGTATIIPDSGSDLVAPMVRTSGPCDAVAADGSTSDGYAAFLSGPGVFTPNEGTGRPFGVAVAFSTEPPFSKTEAFTFPFRLNFNDLASEQGAQELEVGEYVVTVQCTDSFLGTVYQEFRAGLTFTTPTSYATSNALPPTTTPTATPSSSPSPTPSPSPSPSPPPTPSPTPTQSLTPIPSPSPTPTAIASGGTSGTGTGSGAGSATSTSTRGGLASTGVPAESLFVAGLGLSVLGSGLMLAARRRRTG